MTQSDGWLVLGRCQAVGKKSFLAGQNYARSLELATKELGEWNCDLAPIYEGLGACESNNKNFRLAEDIYKKVAQLDCLKIWF